LVGFTKECSHHASWLISQALGHGQKGLKMVTDASLWMQVRSKRRGGYTTIFCLLVMKTSAICRLNLYDVITNSKHLGYTGAILVATELVVWMRFCIRLIFASQAMQCMELFFLAHPSTFCFDKIMFYLFHGNSASLFSEQ
jgi:hypothetical protein